jgi:hypothetical protein
MSKTDIAERTDSGRFRGKEKTALLELRQYIAEQEIAGNIKGPLATVVTHLLQEADRAYCLELTATEKRGGTGFRPPLQRTELISLIARATEDGRIRAKTALHLLETMRKAFAHYERISQRFRSDACHGNFSARRVEKQTLFK